MTEWEGRFQPPERSDREPARTPEHTRRGVARIGGMLSGLGVLIYIATGLVGSVYDLAVVNAVWGFGGIVLGIIVIPITFLAAPFYALFEWGSWALILLEGGGLFLALTLTAIGDALES